MPGPQDFSPQDLRLMQGLAQQVTALRPELVNSDATVGEMAWVWGKDRTDLGGTWRHRLWFSGGRLAGWGWIFLPYRVMRSDGQLLDVTTTSLTWQVHPDARWPVTVNMGSRTASAGGQRGAGEALGLGP